MYKISIPVFSSALTAATRENYLREIKKAQADRVFLIVDIYKDFSVEEIKKNVDFLRDNGIEPAIWVAYTIGHGGPITNKSTNDNGWTYMRNLRGEIIQDVYCPLNEKFLTFVSEKISLLAKTGVKKIQIDDDFRISQHGDSLCCLCDEHMKKIKEILGEEVGREELYKKAFIGGKNKYRTAYLKAQGDSLKGMARKLRNAVDLVDKTISLSFCSAWSEWDIDGTTSVELCKIFAGENKPFLRLHGAPYWVNNGKRLTSIIEVSKMFASFCQGEGIEIFSEGDNYPRPRYKVPASYLELYDVALRADGTMDGIKKYMLDYVSSCDYERGYVDRHVENLKDAKAITKAFQGSINEGVRVFCFPKTTEEKYIEEDYDVSWLNESPYCAGDIFAGCGIPTTYTGEGIVPAVFGENVKYISKTVLKEGGILDAVSAKILHEQGVDVGIERISAFKPQRLRVENFANEKIIIEENCRYLLADYKEGIISESFTTIQKGGGWLSVGVDGKMDDILSYRYQNNNGQKFLVFCFSMEELISKSVLKTSYCRQAQLIEGIEWISGKRLPATTRKNPELYIITKRKNKSLFVGVFNCYADHIKNLPIYLDKKYKKIKPIVGDVRLQKDKTIASGNLHAFDYLAFEVIE